MATIHAAHCHALLLALTDLGVDTTPLLIRASLDGIALAQPDLRVSRESARCLWRNAILRCSTSDLSLRAAQVLPLGAYGVLDHLFTHCQTVGDAFSAIAQFGTIVNNESRVIVERNGSNVHLWFDDPGDPGGKPRYAQEFNAATFIVRARLAWRTPFTPGQVCFAYARPRPQDVSLLTSFFGVTPRFSARRFELVFPLSLWQRSTGRSDPLLFEALCAYAERRAQQIPSPVFSDRVRKAIVERLSAGHSVRLAEISRTVCCSRRTLQRRLRSQGSSFSGIVEQTRQWLAEHYLETSDLAICEIASLVGYAHESGMSRAFKKWHGISPRAFRRRLRMCRKE